MWKAPHQQFACSGEGSHLRACKLESIAQMFLPRHCRRLGGQWRHT
uniref:Si660001f06 n=1 Tax=Arundo donax TaxID=35708 RepID=A0A0A8XY82_ARUDO